MVGDNCYCVKAEGTLVFNLSVAGGKTFKSATMFWVFWHYIKFLNSSPCVWFFVTEVQHCRDLKSWAVPVLTNASIKNVKSMFLTYFCLEVGWYLKISKLWRKHIHTGHSVHLCGLLILKDRTDIDLKFHPFLGAAALCLSACPQVGI